MFSNRYVDEENLKSQALKQLYKVIEVNKEDLVSLSSYILIQGEYIYKNMIECMGCPLDDEKEDLSLRYQEIYQIYYSFATILRNLDDNNILQLTKIQRKNLNSIIHAKNYEHFSYPHEAIFTTEFYSQEFDVIQLVFDIVKTNFIDMEDKFEENYYNQILTELSKIQSEIKTTYTNERKELIDADLL